MEAILSSWNVCTYLLSLKWCHISLISRLFLISSYLSHFSISACIQQYWFLKKSFQLSLCLDISWQFRILRLEKEFQSPPTWSSKRPASGTDASAPHTPTLSCRNPSTTRRSATFLCWTFLFSFEVFSEKKNILDETYWQSICTPAEVWARSPFEIDSLSHAACSGLSCEPAMTWFQKSKKSLF